MSDVSGRYLILCTSNDVTVERESSFFRQLMLDIIHMGLILFFFKFKHKSSCIGVAFSTYSCMCIF